MMRILVTGGSGMLGSEVVRLLNARKIPCLAPTHAEMDITDPQAVFRVFDSFRPTAVIHCAAWTKVDDAEKHPAECMAVNAQGTQHITLACLRQGCAMIYVSTDYVFGDAVTDAPHAPDEAPAPLNVYGLSKLQGEIAVRSLLTRYFIVRAAWLYDLKHPGFANTILTRASQGESLRVVDDQLGTPTWVRDLAAALLTLPERTDYGYHAAVPRGSCTWYGFAKALVSAAGIPARISPVTSDAWNAPARRPHNSLLVPTLALPDWRESLAKAMKDR